MSTPSYKVDKSKLPPQFPTHRHDPAFWCSLGRAVATFGFLEEVLKWAVFALTGTCPAPEDEAKAAAAVQRWSDRLEEWIVNPLGPQIDAFGAAARQHPDSRYQHLEEFIADLRAAAKLRNLICHGSWREPDESGASVPFYVTGKPGRREICDTAVTVAWLNQLQTHVAELACEVINTVTHMGHQFPGHASAQSPNK